MPLVSDVSDPDSVEQLADRVLDELGRVDIVVNNAGAARGPDRHPVVELDLAEWHKVIDVNLHGVLYMSRTFAQRFLAAGTEGCILNISSVGGKIMGPNTAAYSASKAGVHALTAAMAKELGDRGIRVNALCPGIIDTSRLDDVGREEAWERMIRTQIPLGRPGQGLDIATAAVFLCSDQGSWVTGQQWNVDGGQLTIH